MRAACGLALAALLAGATSACSGAVAPPRAGGRPVTTSATPRTPAPQSRPPRLHVRVAGWRLPYPLSRSAALLQGPHTLLVAGGLRPGDLTTARSIVVDPGSGHWRPAGTLPVAVHDTSAARLRGRPAVIGGGNSAEQAVVQVRHGRHWSVAGRLPRPRSDLTAVQLDGRVYAVGGYDGRSPALAVVPASRDGRRWHRAIHLRSAVRYPATATLDHAIWVFGGVRGALTTDLVQRIDPSAGTVRTVARLPHPRGHAAAVAIGRRILLVGGRDARGRPTERMWWFDPRRRTFTPAGRLPYPLADTAVALPAPGDRADARTAYLVGGESPRFERRVIRLRWH